MTYYRERVKIVDLFPRTATTPINYARPVPLHGKSAKHIPDINLMLSFHVETVVLLSQQKPSDRIEVDLDLNELDITSAEMKSTYALKNGGLQEYIEALNVFN